MKIPIRIWMILAMLACMVCWVNYTWALINPNYTPVNLYRDAEAIFRVELGPLAEKGRCPLNVLKPLKGGAPEALALEADLSDEKLLHDLRNVLAKDRAVPALVFRGGFATGASGSDDAAEDDNSRAVGAICVGLMWFGLYEAEGKLRIGSDQLDLKAVWAGGDATLEQVLEYVKADPRAEVPVHPGASWATETRLANLDGAVWGCQVIELVRRQPCIFIQGEKGDRLFQYMPESNPQNSGFQEITEKVRLTSSSRAAAWADFNGDGRLDLASANGKSLRVFLQGADGTFAAAGETILPQECLRLAAMDVGKLGQAGLLSTAKGAPLLLVPAGGGRFEVQTLPTPAPEMLQALGELGPPVASDFDGDGVLDIVQPAMRGALIYKGHRAGGFTSPEKAADALLGRGLTDARCGDFDANGLPDLLVTGQIGCRMLINRGGGRLEEKFLESGEIPYISKEQVIGGAVCDINLDGREDVLLLYANMGAHIFFNRGFRCFGHAIPLDFANSTLASAPSINEGQQAATIADVDGDDAPDMVVVTTDGDLWVLGRSARKPPVLGITVRLRPDVTAGPVRLVAFDGTRCLGVRNLGPAAPLYFGKAEKGPFTLKWRLPGGTEEAKNIVVLAPLEFEVPPH